jgi:hypothetical protein
MNLALGAYLSGVLIGIWRVDGRPATRVWLALLWPLGPLAFVVTLAGLLLASLIAFPLVGGIVAGAGVIWLLLS